MFRLIFSLCAVALVAFAAPSPNLRSGNGDKKYLTPVGYDKKTSYHRNTYYNQEDCENQVNTASVYAVDDCASTDFGSTLATCDDTVATLSYFVTFGCAGDPVSQDVDEHADAMCYPIEGSKGQYSRSWCSTHL